MAGEGSRFKKAGYAIPKFMIEVKGKTLFEWSLDSLSDYAKHISKYIFITQKKDCAKEFIEIKCKNYNITNLNIIELNYLTDGQATTCMSAIPYCKLDEPIFIYNIDTYIEPGAMKCSQILEDGHIPCFNAEGNHWSFVSVDENNLAIKISEKKRISNNCSVGAYYFSTANLFKEMYEEYYANPSNIVNGEKYIAPMYNYMIEKGKKVSISLIENSKVHVLGTPEELNKFKLEC